MTSISIPSASGWRFARYGGQPEPFPGTEGTRCGFSILEGPEGPPADGLKFFIHSELVMKFDASGPEELALASAPHVLQELLNDPESLPKLVGGYLSLHQWLTERLRGLHRPYDLRCALDDGSAKHMALCREDILRILLRRYDETPMVPRGQPFRVPDEAEMTVEELMASPIKRRYYRGEVWRSEAMRLYGQKQIEGHGDGGPFWIEAVKAEETRGKVEEYERRALNPQAPRPATERFFKGERHAVWQRLRELVKGAREHVWIEDAWLGSDVVALLREDLPEGVQLRVLGPERGNRSWDGALASLKRLAEELAGRLEARTTGDLHDRFVYVDGDAWRSTDSLKDLAKNRMTKLEPRGEGSADDVAEFERRWAGAQRVIPA